MANRFTATEKWIDPWFCELSEKDKLFWIYLVDNCDHAGIWQVNWPLVKFHIKDYVFNEKVFSGRVTVLKENKWFLPRFIEFQYKTGLNPENRAHQSVLNILKKEGAYKGLTRGFKARKDMDMDMDMDKDMDKDSKEGIVKGGKNVPPTEQDVELYCKERNNGIKARDFINHYTANGWMRGKTKIKDWHACVRTWETKREDERGISKNSSRSGNGKFDNYEKEINVQDLQ